MNPRRSVLVLGASYGALLGIKLVAAGHDVRLVCLPAEAELVNREGVKVRMPIVGHKDLVELDSKALPGRLSACRPADAATEGHDLVVFAMQEPQYGASGVHELLTRIIRAGLPCMSIMNMPLPPYLARLPGIDVALCAKCYTDNALWRDLDSSLLTLCSPDPQAFRPAGEPSNVLQVRLPTNFKASRFDSSVHTEMLRALAADIDAVQFPVGSERVAVPVKLKVHDSLFVPLAKWAMLVAGNYRCITSSGTRSIREAVHGDLEESRAIYNWVVRLCIALGASDNDMVPFERYAAAALSLTSPSSAARALAGGARNIERVDMLVQALGAQHGMRDGALDHTVALVDGLLARNRTDTRVPG
jgi:hypothetical protein